MWRGCRYGKYEYTTCDKIGAQARTKGSGIVPQMVW